MSREDASKGQKLKSGGKRFSMFTVVGVTNFVVDIGVLNLFLWLSPTRDPLMLVLYNGVALVAANANSYVWNALWTFRGRLESGPRQKVLFVLQALVGGAVSSGLFWLIVRGMLVYTDAPAYMAGNVAKVVSVFVASVISFFLMRYLVFSHERRLEKAIKGRL